MNVIGSDQLLKERNILITGAAGCLGQVAAKCCAKSGANLILLDKNLPELEKLYDYIVAQDFPEPALYPIDFEGATEQHYLDLAETLEREFGVLHGLVHNAAKFAVLGPVDNIDSQSWSSVLNVNLNAPFLLTRVLLRILRNASSASIIFTSDSVARSAKAYWGAYGISKIAAEAFARILADEQESAGIIRVNTLVPGAVDSPLRRRAFPAENREKLAAAQSLENLYIYLLSSASQHKTGQVFEAAACGDLTPCTK